jgi:cAMP-dependent protein kinase regulator
MDTYERAKIADCIKETTFLKGETVIREGDEANIFYIVIEGSAVAQKHIVQEDDSLRR